MKPFAARDILQQRVVVLAFIIEDGDIVAIVAMADGRVTRLYLDDIRDAGPGTDWPRTWLAGALPSERGEAAS